MTTSVMYLPNRRPVSSGEHFWMPRPLCCAAIIFVVFSGLAAHPQTKIFSHEQSDARVQLLQFLETDRPQDAISLGEKAVTLWPEDADIHHYLGLAYFKTGQPKPAREQLERARDLSQKSPDMRFDLALVCLSQQDYAAAANELQVVVKVRPTNALAHVLLGRSYLNSNRSVQAIDEFKTALRLDPGIRLGHYHLGFAHASLAHTQEAMTEDR